MNEEGTLSPLQIPPHHLVRTSCTPWLPPLAKAHTAPLVLPLPTEPASLGFGGGPLSQSLVHAAQGGWPDITPSGLPRPVPLGEAGSRNFCQAHVLPKMIEMTSFAAGE